MSNCKSAIISLYQRSYFVKGPTLPPINVRAIPISSSDIYVQWEDIPYEGHKGFLDGYLVKYLKIGTKNFHVKKSYFGVYSKFLVGLEPYTLYRIEVAGYNNGGEGPPEYAMIATLEGGRSWCSISINKNDLSCEKVSHAYLEHKYFIFIKMHFPENAIKYSNFRGSLKLFKL